MHSSGFDGFTITAIPSKATFSSTNGTQFSSSFGFIVLLASLISVFPGQNSLKPALVPGPFTVISTLLETFSL